ncbi:MAG TPA: hypothetical protein VFK54_07135 [Candidatus Limnocylindrales bacterium]|nr:hypothetical protein [Candidatus Limnocylindrales bacterium]
MRTAVLSLAVGVFALAAPAAVLAHGLVPQYQSPLPLAVYLTGAAITVGLSFLFVLLRDVRALPVTEGRLVQVPAWLRVGLRGLGLLALLWIFVQGVLGGSSDAQVADLFVWVYGWVGVAAVSALLAPIWEWLDPWATLYDAAAAAFRRLGVRGWAPAEIPRWLRGWPAVVGLAMAVWLELVEGGGPQTLFVVLAGYTAFTLAMMAQFGRDEWRAHGETFTVWFRLLNRLAPFGIVPAAATDPAADAGDEDVPGPDAIDDRVLRRRPFASGLLEARWTTADVALLAIGTASILYDGLSQTVPWASLFGAPQIGPETLLLFAFVGVIIGAALVVARMVSVNAIGAGLLPIAVGYLVAHYLTYLLVDGQRIVVALSDPLQQGADLFGTAFHEPNGDFLPPGLLWTVQLAAVVGGHMLGAWAGHVTAARDAVGPADARRQRATDPRLREVPLALVMVGLTTLTLWSLGQAIVITDEAARRLLPA